MTDASNIPDENALSAIVKVLFVRVVQAAAVGFAGWFINRLSLAGYDFKTWGIDSEAVKQVIIGVIFISITAPREAARLFGLGVYRIRLLGHDICKLICAGFKTPLPEKDDTNV